MRFAWLQKNTTTSISVTQGRSRSLALIKMVYNTAFWVFLLPFIFSTIDYSLGFIAFTIVVLIRLVLNLYTNNIYKPTPEQYENYPFRI